MQFKKRVIHAIVAPIIVSAASSALVYSQSALAKLKPTDGVDTRSEI